MNFTRVWCKRVVHAVVFGVYHKPQLPPIHRPLFHLVLSPCSIWFLHLSLYYFVTTQYEQQLITSTTCPDSRRCHCAVVHLGRHRSEGIDQCVATLLARWCSAGLNKHFRFRERSLSAVMVHVVSYHSLKAGRYAKLFVRFRQARLPS